MRLKMSRVNARVLAGLGAVTLAAALSGCDADDVDDGVRDADEAAEVAEDGADAIDDGADNTDDPDGASDDSADEGGGGPVGTVTFDGQEYELSGIMCNPVPVNDNEWRIIGDIDGGEVQLDEGPERIVIRFDDGEDWSNSGRDNEIPLEVGEHGSVGDTVVHWSGGDADVSVNITC